MVIADTNDAAAAYVGVRARTSAMLRTASAGDADRKVPACPDWTVKDVAAHMAGVCEDILAGNLDGVATDAWTNAQVARHADDSLDDVLDSWDQTGPDDRSDACRPSHPPPPPSSCSTPPTTSTTCEERWASPARGTATPCGSV